MIQQAFSHPDAALIGVPKGQVSGVDVLDIDPRHEGDLWWRRNWHRMPETRQLQTRSGGAHILFRAAPELRNSQSKIAPGIDVRAGGGYVIWWPATGLRVVPTSLAPWPGWLLAVLQKGPAAPKGDCWIEAAFNPDVTAFRTVRVASRRYVTGAFSVAFGPCLIAKAHDTGHRGRRQG